MIEMFRSTSSKLILLLVIFLVASLQYQFWLGEGGYFPHQALTQQIKQQAEVNTELKERNRILAAEVFDLKNGTEAIEEHARLDLGLIKPNETFVQMSTISTHYKPIYIDPNAKIEDLFTSPLFALPQTDEEMQKFINRPDTPLYPGSRPPEQ
jgi:cell division protein FtsB